MTKSLKELGTVFTFNNYLIFFGNKNAQPAEIQACFPEKRLCLLKQTHSATLIEAKTTTAEREADAQWSKNKEHLLLVKSADCLPILLVSPKNKTIMAIHAGWRGVAQQITEKSIQSLKLQKDSHLHIWIGPHIQKKSFEVAADVAKEILTPFGFTVDSSEAAAYVDKVGDKYFIALAALVEQSLIKLGIEKENIYISDVDTRQSPDHFSYRRGEKDVRNYSFVTQI